MSSPSCVLAIDVGNTRAKFGLFHLTHDGRAVPVDICACVLSQTPDLAEFLQIWWQTHPSAKLDGAIVAGSQPDIRDRLLHHWPLVGCKPTVINGYQQIPIQVDLDFPERVGMDRLLNVFAASRLLNEKRSAIVVDSGTATTVDLMTSDFVFRGGSILPGLRLSAHAMHDYTARLPLLNVDEDLAELPELPGRNTEAAMRAGLFIGQLGAVRELVARLTIAASDRFNESTRPGIFVTGGGGRHLASHLPRCMPEAFGLSEAKNAQAMYIDSLPLHGLAMLAAGSGGRAGGTQKPRDT